MAGVNRATGPPTVWVRAWRRWVVIAHRLGDAQARLLLSAFYLVILAPFALGLRLFSDPLRLVDRHGPLWLPRPKDEGAPAVRARRQS
jgi:hypothetical protein